MSVMCAPKEDKCIILCLLALRITFPAHATKLQVDPVQMSGNNMAEYGHIAEDL